MKRIFFSLVLIILISLLSISVFAVFGDVNGDEAIDVTDAVKITQYLAGWDIEFSDEDKQNADVHFDGILDVKDAVKMSQFLAKWSVVLGPEVTDEIESTMELKKAGELKYYLYTPKNPAENMPLIVYLHGGTNKREDVAALLTTEGFPKYLYDGYYGDLRAYVAVPKLENDYTGWIDVSDQIRTMVKSISTNYAIDMSKVSLTGHSMGGTGTYQLQTKLQNTFACIAPMSGSIKNTEDTLTALAKTKIWAFIGTADTIVSPDSSREIIAALIEQGANAKITELDGATHFDVPALVYKNPELIQWLVNCGE